MIETYGSGEFDETFTIFGPTECGSAADLITFAREEAQIIPSARHQFVFVAAPELRGSQGTRWVFGSR